MTTEADIDTDSPYHRPPLSPNKSLKKEFDHKLYNLSFETGYQDEEEDYIPFILCLLKVSTKDEILELISIEKPNRENILTYILNIFNKYNVYRKAEIETFKKIAISHKFLTNLKTVYGLLMKGKEIDKNIDMDYIIYKSSKRYKIKDNSEELVSPYSINGTLKYYLLAELTNPTINIMLFNVEHIENTIIPILLMKEKAIKFKITGYVDNILDILFMYNLGADVSELNCRAFNANDEDKDLVFSSADILISFSTFYPHDYRLPFAVINGYLNNMPLYANLYLKEGGMGFSFVSPSLFKFRKNILKVVEPIKVVSCNKEALFIYKNVAQQQRSTKKENTLNLITFTNKSSSLQYINKQRNWHCNPYDETVEWYYNVIEEETERLQIGFDLDVLHKIFDMEMEYEREQMYNAFNTFDEITLNEKEKYYTPIKPFPNMYNNKLIKYKLSQIFKLYTPERYKLSDNEGEKYKLLFGKEYIVPSLSEDYFISLPLCLIYDKENTKFVVKN
jgi:hypothetical protein